VASFRQQGGTIKPSRRYENTTNNKKTLYDWLGKTPTGQRHAKTVMVEGINPQ
jgi:hypothetical protein